MQMHTPKRLLIKTTSDGRKLEVIDRAIFLDGRKEADELMDVRLLPHREAVLKVLPEATHMAGRVALTWEEASLAHSTLRDNRQAYSTSEYGITERLRAATNNMLLKRGDD